MPPVLRGYNRDSRHDQRGAPRCRFTATRCALGARPTTTGHQKILGRSSPHPLTAETWVVDPNAWRRGKIPLPGDTTSGHLERSAVRCGPFLCCGQSQVTIEDMQDEPRSKSGGRRPRLRLGATPLRRPDGRRSSQDSEARRLSLAPTVVVQVRHRREPGRAPQVNLTPLPNRPTPSSVALVFGREGEGVFTQRESSPATK